MSEFQAIGLAVVAVLFAFVFILYPKNTKSDPKNKAVDKKDKSGHHYAMILDELTVSGTRPIPKQLAVEDAKVDIISRNRTTGRPEELEEFEKIRIAAEKQIQRERNKAIFKDYPKEHKLRYCGALDEDLVARTPNELDALLKALEGEPDLQIADCYNHHNYGLAIWNGEQWLRGDLYELINGNPYISFEVEVRTLLGDVKYSSVLAAFEERLLSASTDKAFNKIIAEGNPLFTHTTKVSAEYPFSRWEWLRDRLIAFRDKEVRDFTDNIAKATNKQVYDIALSVADEPLENLFVNIIRREFSARMAILKELDLAKQYQMDQQEQVKQELDEAARFF